MPSHQLQLKKYRIGFCYVSPEFTKWSYRHGEVTEPRRTYSLLFLLINTHSINRKKAALEIVFNRIIAVKAFFQYICCNCSKAVKFKLGTKMCYLNRVNAGVIYRTHLWPLSLNNKEIHLRLKEVINSNILPGHRISVLKILQLSWRKPNWGDTFIMKITNAN